MEVTNIVGKIELIRRIIIVLASLYGWLENQWQLMNENDNLTNDELAIRANLERLLRLMEHIKD